MSQKNVVEHISNLADGIHNKEELHRYMIAVVRAAVDTHDPVEVLGLALKALPESYSGGYRNTVESILRAT